MRREFFGWHRIGPGIEIRFAFGMQGEAHPHGVATRFGRLWFGDFIRRLALGKPLHGLGMSLRGGLFQPKHRLRRMAEFEQSQAQTILSAGVPGIGAKDERAILLRERQAVPGQGAVNVDAPAHLALGLAEGFTGAWVFANAAPQT